MNYIICDVFLKINYSVFFKRCNWPSNTVSLTLYCRSYDRPELHHLTQQIVLTKVLHVSVRHETRPHVGLNCSGGNIVLELACTPDQAIEEESHDQCENQNRKGKGQIRWRIQNPLCLMRSDQFQEQLFFNNFTIISHFPLFCFSLKWSILQPVLKKLDHHNKTNPSSAALE